MSFFSIRRVGNKEGVCPTSPPPEADHVVTRPSIALSVAIGHPRSFLPSFLDPLTLWCVSTSLAPGIGSTEMEKTGNLLTNHRQVESRRGLKKGASHRFWNLRGGRHNLWPGMVRLGL